MPLAGTAGLRWVLMLFMAGFVPSEKLESNHTSWWPGGAGAELGDSTGAHSATLPPNPELHTPLGQLQCQNMLEALPSLHLTRAHFGDQEWQLDLGWGAWG